MNPCSATRRAPRWRCKDEELVSEGEQFDFEVGAPAKGVARGEKSERESSHRNCQS